jgi:hypothetical protein
MKIMSGIYKFEIGIKEFHENMKYHQYKDVNILISSIDLFLMLPDSLLQYFLHYLSNQDRKDQYYSME